MFRLYIVLSFCVFFVGCGPITSEFEARTGKYESPLGVFNSTLYLDNNVELQQNANDLARIAYLSVVSLKQSGFNDELDEMAKCANNISVFAMSRQRYNEHCDTDSIGCFNSFTENIFLKNGSGYNCRNFYTPGHEVMHKVLECRGQFDHRSHTTENVFAWNPNDGVEGWATDTAEDIIKNNPNASCIGD